MKVNPSVISWNAPTTNTDGTEIQYEVNYLVGIGTSADTIEPMMTLPAQLQEDGRFEAPIELLALENGEHFLALKAFAKEDPERVSEWSAPVQFAISEEIPDAPFGLQVS